ncbi:MAG: hypothetical protein JEY96_03295 [Bacteroidales bacterium]|nr:hypothetical protein [Bacteroidales bacterium]
MRKFNVTILLITFFFLGVLLDRAFLYYENGEKNKRMLLEQDEIKRDYKLLIEQFERVEEELQLRKIEDSVFIYDSVMAAKDM